MQTLFDMAAPAPMESCEMGLAPGGRMRQEIYEDPFDLNDWDMENKSRCFVHIANSLIWRTITSQMPPTAPFTAKEYKQYNLPWFDYYSDNSTAVKGSEKLNGLKSVVQMGEKKGDVPLPENESHKTVSQGDASACLRLRLNRKSFKSERPELAVNPGSYLRFLLETSSMKECLK